MKRLSFVIGFLLVIGLWVGIPAPAGALTAGNYVLDFTTNSASPGNASISYAGQGGALAGSYIPISGVNVMGQGMHEALSGAVLTFTSGNFVSYMSGIWTFAAGGTLSIWEGNTELYAAALGTTSVYSIGGAIRIAAAPLNTTYVNGGFFEPFLGFEAVADTTTLGDLNQTFYGTAVRTAGGKGPGVGFVGLSTGGVEGPIAPIPTSALLFVPALLGLIGMRKRFRR